MLLMPWIGCSAKYGPVAGPATPLAAASARFWVVKNAPDGGEPGRNDRAGSTLRAVSSDCWATVGDWLAPAMMPPARTPADVPATASVTARGLRIITPWLLPA